LRSKIPGIDPRAGDAQDRLRQFGDGRIRVPVSQRKHLLGRTEYRRRQWLRIERVHHLFRRQLISRRVSALCLNEDDGRQQQHRCETTVDLSHWGNLQEEI
jgi:hypothetical protein